MANALLYNLSEDSVSQKLKFSLMKVGLKFRDVSPNEYAHPIGYLAGMSGFEPSQEPIEGNFEDEMIILNGISSRQLDNFLTTIRRMKIAKLPLLAVVTEDNSKWDSIRLHNELTAEREAMKNGQAAVHNE